MPRFPINKVLIKGRVACIKNSHYNNVFVQVDYNELKTFIALTVDVTMLKGIRQGEFVQIDGCLEDNIFAKGFGIHAKFISKLKKKEWQNRMHLSGIVSTITPIADNVSKMTMKSFDPNISSDNVPIFLWDKVVTYPVIGSAVNVECYFRNRSESPETYKFRDSMISVIKYTLL